MKKISMILVLIIGMMFLVLPSVSALELNPFADKKIYEPVISHGGLI
jgi:hypothetical protein